MEHEAMRSWDQFRVLTKPETRNFYVAQPRSRRGFMPLFPKRALLSTDDEERFRVLAKSHTKSRFSKG
jgi:hypothetical protein